VLKKKLVFALILISFIILELLLISSDADIFKIIGFTSLVASGEILFICRKDR